MTEAKDIFAALLRSHENATVQRAITRPLPVLRNTQAREAMMFDLLQAEKAGGIELVYSKKGFAGHIVEKIRLKDPSILYAFSGIEPTQSRRAGMAKAFLESVAPITEEGGLASAALEQAILDGTQAWGYKDDIDAMADAVRSIDGVFSRENDDVRDMRALSIAATGDSKVVQRHWRRICLILKEIGCADEDEEDDAIAARLGVFRHIPTIHVSGPLFSDAVDVSRLELVGLSAKDAAALRPLSSAAAVLTIENWESFRRHVNEVASAGEIVVYTGGWPSSGVQALLKNLRSLDVPKFHWGDIDPAGIRIAERISLLVGGCNPHLMNVELVETYGRSRPLIRPPARVEGSPFEDLAAYLATPGAKYLEQEGISPLSLRR